MWALGSHSQNYHQSFSGRRAVLCLGTRSAADRSRAGARQLLLSRRHERPLMHEPSIERSGSRSERRRYVSGAGSGSVRGQLRRQSGGGIGGLYHDLTGLVSGLVHDGAGVAQHVVGSAFGLSAGALLQAVDSWVAQGAVWLLDQVGLVLSSTTGRRSRKLVVRGAVSRS